MNQKKLLTISMIILAIFIGTMVYFVSTKESKQQAKQTPVTKEEKKIEQPAIDNESSIEPQPAPCVDKPEGEPMITSVSADSGKIGTKLEIVGCSFSGFEGDKNAWIENNTGIKGILYGEEGSTSTLLKVTLKSPLCQKDNSYSGNPCDAWLKLTPGKYKIYTMPWGKKSNEVEFTIL